MLLPIKKLYSKRTKHWNITCFVRFFVSNGLFRAIFFTFYSIAGHLSAFSAGLSAFLRFSTDKMLIFIPGCPYHHVRLNSDCNRNRTTSHHWQEYDRARSQYNVLHTFNVNEISDLTLGRYTQTEIRKK